MANVWINLQPFFYKFSAVTVLNDHTVLSHVIYCILTFVSTKTTSLEKTQTKESKHSVRMEASSFKMRTKTSSIAG